MQQGAQALTKGKPQFRLDVFKTKGTTFWHPDRGEKTVTPDGRVRYSGAFVTSPGGQWMVSTLTGRNVEGKWYSWIARDENDKETGEVLQGHAFLRTRIRMAGMRFLTKLFGMEKKE